MGVFGLLLEALLISASPFLAVSGIFQSIGFKNAPENMFIVGWIAITLGFVFLAPPAIQTIIAVYADKMDEGQILNISG